MNKLQIDKITELEIQNFDFSLKIHPDFSN